MLKRFVHGVREKRGKHNYPCWLIASLVMISVIALIGCGGSSSSGSSGGTVPDRLTSYVMPDEISAVPTSGTQDVARAYFQPIFRALSRSAAADLDADSDYHTSVTRKYVEEHTLEQFDILEEVLTALNQTHYYDQIGQPAYQAMVVQVGGDGEQATKTLAPWVVEADMIDQNGDVVEPADAVDGGDYDIRVRCWIEEVEKGEAQLIRAEFVITEAATQNSDGSFADYGEWTLNVKFGESENDFFAATCELGNDGGNVITLNEKFSENGPGGEYPMEVAAVMHRNESQGYGKVSYPDWEAVHGSEGRSELPHKEAVYAYNDALLAVQDENEEEPTYKSRSEDPVDMTHRYGVFDAVTGQDVLKTKSFGFPFIYTDGGMTKRGYYGAWQGRHQIWMDGDSLPPENTALTREDWGNPDTDAETFKMGPTFDGTFVKRSYEIAHLNDIKNIPVEIWVNQDYQLTYSDGDGTWYYCSQVDWESHTPSCLTEPENFGAVYGWDILTKNANDNRKHININGWDQNINENRQYVYLAANTDDSNPAGIYLMGREGEDTNDFGALVPLEQLDTDDVKQLWVNIGGSLYVEWTGTKWVEKEVVFFNDEFHKPEFGPDADDKDYILPEGRELYVNLQGANYVVRNESGITTIKMELQTAANPANVGSNGALATLGDYTFREPWADGNSTYAFDTDSDSDTFLMLVYATIGDNDKDQSGNDNDGVAVGNVVTSDLWGIVAYDGGTEVMADGEPLAFNWEYDSDGAEMQDWGSVTYLKNNDNSYKLLDDPIRFVSFEAQNNAGETKTLALQFDGWMMGLPDMYHELSKNDWEMSPDLADKIINLAAGTGLTDASDATQGYLLKPLEISQFLSIVTNTTGLDLPDVDQADEINLSLIDIYTPPDMGGMPSNTDILYSEGKLLVAY